MPRFDNAVDGGRADPFDRREAEADGVFGRRKSVIAFVDVRREQLKATRS